MTCEVYAADDGTLRRQIVHSFVAPGVGAPGSVPVDDPVAFDDELDDVLEALE